MRAAERGVLLAALAVLAAGLVSLGTGEGDDEAGTPTGGPSPTPTPPGWQLSAGTMKVTTFAQGSGELAFSATVIADPPLLAVLRGTDRVVTLTTTPEGARVAVDGRVRLDCAAVRAGRVEPFDLVLSSGDEQLIVPVPAAAVRAAAVAACREIAPVPAPTGQPVRK